MTDLSKIDLLKVTLRLFLVQSAWTSTSMQSEGFVYCLSPALKKIFPEKQRFKKILKHYQMPINTHPFLVGVLAGVILKMEQSGYSTKMIVSNIKATMSPLAALGDPFFYGALTPFSTVMAALVALIFGIIPGMLTLFVLYNGTQLFIRINGIFLGFALGENSLEKIGRLIDSDKTRLLRIITAIASGLLIGVCSREFTNYTDTNQIIFLAIACLSCVACSFFLIKKRTAWIYLLPAFLLVTLILEVVI